MHEDRLEVELRAALHHEMAMARIGVTAPQVRTGIAARERSRRWTRAALGIAAVLAIALSAPVVAPLAQRALAPDQPIDTAVTVRLETGGDLVVEKVSFDGSAVVIARLAQAANWLLPTVDPARLAPGSTGTMIAFHPDGYLAVAVSAADEEKSPVAVLVWNLAHPADEPVRIDAAADSVGQPIIGWTPDGRLVVNSAAAYSRLDVLDARTKHVVSVTLPDQVFVAAAYLSGSVAGGGLITSTPDNRVVVMEHEPAMFRSTVATADLPRDGGAATLTEGRPATVWAVRGVEPTWGVKAGVIGSAYDANGWTITGVRVEGQDLGSSPIPDAQTWTLFGSGEQLVGWPAWDATLRGLWLLQGTGRRLDLVHLDGPGLASARATLPWDGTTGIDQNAIVGVAADGRGLAVRGTAGDLLVDGDSGRWVEIASGARFVGWSRAATAATPGEQPFCAPSVDEDLSTTQIAGFGEPFVGGLAAGTGSEPSPRPAADAASLAAAHTFVGGGLRLLLPDDACASFVSAEAVPVDDPGATPVAFDPASAAPGGPGGLLGMTEPPAGRWIVRLRLAVDGGPGLNAHVLLFRVEVAAAAPSPDPGASPGARLVSGQPMAGSLPSSVVPTWTVAHGGADAPADGASTFGDPTSPPLRAGPVVASVACTGDGAILVAAATAAESGIPATPAADRWVRVECADPRAAAPMTVNLPDARGGETVLLVERRPTRADDLLGYTVVLGQPIDAACDTPTPELAARVGLRASPDGAPVAGVLVAYELPAGSRAMAAGELAAAASQPALTGAGGALDGPWSLALPAGLCASEWKVQEAEAGATELPSDASSSASHVKVGHMRLSLDDPGDWVVAVTLTVPGPDDVVGSATLLWHVRVAEDATPSP
jgi:hypothetical protein